MNNSELSCSIVLVGDGSVGKSTIINAFRTDGFQPIYKQTIGCDFYEKQLIVRTTEKISLRVWDIGGQSISSKNLASYVQHADGILFVYDITNRDSFQNLNDWVDRIKVFNQTKNFYLIGNKYDLTSLRQVSEKDHDKFIVENNFKDSCFCSAKTGENVLKMFYRFAAEITGIPLSQYELAFYDKVLKAHVTKPNDQDEIRNAWADEIEKEDQELERKKNEKNAGCTCLIS
jgi:Ras-related protein Rab-28